MGTISKDSSKDGKEGKDGSKDGSKDNSSDQSPEIQDFQRPLDDNDLFKIYQQPDRCPLNIFNF
jgi:hypothetical protein